jgi:hypothetical protein
MTWRSVRLCHVSPDSPHLCLAYLQAVLVEVYMEYIFPDKMHDGDFIRVPHIKQNPDNAEAKT